jgi:diamine N-acetyltransferase
MYEWMTDPQITRFFRFDASKIRLEGCKSFIENAQSDPNTVHFAIVDESNEYLGTISLKDIDREKKQAEYAISTRKRPTAPGPPWRRPG